MQAFRGQNNEVMKLITRGDDKETCQSFHKILYMCHK